MKIIECPRDALQGISEFVPTEDKIKYINQLLKVGFDTIDFGSFVSPKAIPQMRDTHEVLASLNLSDTESKLLAIVANSRGAYEAANLAPIDYLGFPLSLSETFQRKNTNKSISESLEELLLIQDICQDQNKTLVTYLSMGFGNPYNDPYDIGLVNKFIEKLIKIDIKIISLADTVGMAQPNTIRSVFKSVSREFECIEFGVHLHSDLEGTTKKIEAAYLAGCQRFDGAINGFGGCPLANDRLVGNIATESLIEYFTNHHVNILYDQSAFQQALNMAPSIFLSK